MFAKYIKNIKHSMLLVTCVFKGKKYTLLFTVLHLNVSYLNARSSCFLLLFFVVVVVVCLFFFVFFLTLIES